MFEHCFPFPRATPLSRPLTTPGHRASEFPFCLSLLYPVRSCRALLYQNNNFSPSALKRGQLTRVRKEAQYINQAHPRSHQCRLGSKCRLVPTLTLTSAVLQPVPPVLFRPEPIHTHLPSVPDSISSLRCQVFESLRTCPVRLQTPRDSSCGTLPPDMHQGLLCIAPS